MSKGTDAQQQGGYREQMQDWGVTGALLWTRPGRGSEWKETRLCRIGLELGSASSGPGPRLPAFVNEGFLERSK